MLQGAGKLCNLKPCVLDINRLCGNVSICVKTLDMHGNSKTTLTFVPQSKTMKTAAGSRLTRSAKKTIHCSVQMRKICGHTVRVQASDCSSPDAVLQKVALVTNMVKACDMQCGC